MRLPFTERELAVLVPQVPLDDLRTCVPVYLRVPGPEPIRFSDRHYVRTPWLIRECVPSVWINKYVHHFCEVGYIGVGRFGNVGFGKAGTEGTSLKDWWHQVGIWRSTRYNNVRQHPELEDAPPPYHFFAVEHWLRYDTMTVEQKASVLKGHIARHNWEIERYLRVVQEERGSQKRYRERQLSQERKTLEAAKSLILGLGGSIGMDLINAGKTGQLSLF